MHHPQLHRIPEDGEFVRADLRTLIISTIVLITTVAGGIALIRHSMDIGSYAMEAARFGREEAIVQLVGLIRISSGITALVCVPAGLYAVWIASLTISSGVYPPPGVRLPVSVRAMHGARARTKALRLAALSMVLMAVSVANYLIVPDLLTSTFLRGG